MSKTLLILLGAILVGIIGMITMSSGFTTLYSPYSLTVVLSALFIHSLDIPSVLFRVASVIPLVLFYLIWSFVFLKIPFNITVAQRIFATFLVLLSLVLNISTYSNGIIHQGKLHNHMMYIYNITFILALVTLYLLNRKNPRSTIVQVLM